MSLTRRGPDDYLLVLLGELEEQAVSVKVSCGKSSLDLCCVSPMRLVHLLMVRSCSLLLAYNSIIS